MKTTWAVIIPSYNRANDLKCMLPAVRRAARRVGAKIIVVDDGSLKPLLQKEYPDEQIVVQNNAGPATARNLGAALSSASFLAFIDDDCEPSENWLVELERVLLANPNSIVGGKTVNGLSSSILSQVSQNVTNALVSFLTDAGGRAQFFPSCNLAITAEVFEAIGGFDTDYGLAAGEDRDFCLRASERGVLGILAPSSIVKHSHHLSLRQFFRQHFNYGIGAAQLRKKWGDRAKLTNSSVFDFFVYSGANSNGFNRLAMHCIMMLAQTATFGGLVFGKLKFL